jgi:hypothetical protein
VLIEPRAAELLARHNVGVALDGGVLFVVPRPGFIAHLTALWARGFNLYPRYKSKRSLDPAAVIG